jgi:hypothetical protein
LFNTTITDMETGYKAFRLDALRQLHLTESRFGIEPEITGEICRRRMRVYEIPIAYYGRTYDEGKNISWKDGFRAVFVLIRTRVRPLREPEPRRSDVLDRPQSPGRAGARRQRASHWRPAAHPVALSRESTDRAHRPASHA